MKPLDKLSIFFATGFYVGKIPAAPGTFGTLVGVPLAYLVSLLHQFSWSLTILVLTAFCVFSVWVSDKASIAMGQKDPGCIVIDEIAGYLITMFALPFSFMTAVAGFVFFRIFDIAKPPPVGTLDRRVPGGLGIVLDDLAAGFYAALALRIFLHYFG